MTQGTLFWILAGLFIIVFLFYLVVEIKYKQMYKLSIASLELSLLLMKIYMSALDQNNKEDEELTKLKEAVKYIRANPISIGDKNE